ncbi:MAG: 30S ribosomal protein S17 [Patescibacteria group bacterium]
MRTKTGVITSNKMTKTLVVKVDSYKNHPKYAKKYRVSKKFYVHVEDAAQFNIGDTVTIMETKPVSKLKRWKVTANS